MIFQVFYKQRFYRNVQADSQYLAIDMVYLELEGKDLCVNRRNIVAIPANKTWKKATAQQELFKDN